MSLSLPEKKSLPFGTVSMMMQLILWFNKFSSQMIKAKFSILFLLKISIEKFPLNLWMGPH